jgi:predicted NodU family carbamoyl transferase
MYSIINKNNGNFFVPGHHEGHAASAFFSSNLDNAIIITIDGGGRDYFEDDILTVTFSIWHGKGNKISFIDSFADIEFNIGAFWSSMTKEVFGLSIGYPVGNQCGTVMAMAALGDKNKYKN